MCKVVYGSLDKESEKHCISPAEQTDRKVELDANMDESKKD